MIKAIIFDLDDTLFDCTGTLVDSARKRAAKAMHEAGFPDESEKIYSLIDELSSELGAKADVFGLICERYGMDERRTDKFVEIAINAYNSDVIDTRIKVFDDVEDTLKALKKDHKLFLVTSGAYLRQKRKIELLDLEGSFDSVVIDSEEGKVKSDYFQALLDRYGFQPDEVVSVGDRVVSEIKAGNKLGMITVQMLHGRHKDVKPKSDLEEPDYRITRISHLPNIINSINNKKKHFTDLNIVCVGGGTGMPTVLEGLKKHTRNITAIVGVTDSGRSSGMLRKDMGILPPGDIRNNLVALSESEKLLFELFQYRFKQGNLEGHSLGNLLIAALTDIEGSFEKAINEVSKILNIKGNVIPSSLENTDLCAELEDGSIVEEQHNITPVGKDAKDAKAIKRLFLKKQTTANPKAIEAIRGADCVIIGPGSLYVSVLNNLLHDEIRDAINKNTGAKKVYISNIVTQPFQTDHFNASDHVKEVLRYLEGKLDYAIINKKRPSKELLDKYESDQSFLVEPDTDKIRSLGVDPIISDVMEEVHEKRILFAKRDLLRHDSDKVACEIMNLLSEINDRAHSEQASDERSEKMHQ